MIFILGFAVVWAMVIRIDYKDGTFSWQVAETEVALVQNSQAEMGVPLKGTAATEVEAMKAGAESIKELKRRRELAKNYPKVIEFL